MGTADLVLSEIKLTGATNVSRRIDTDENFGRSVMAGIGSGDSTWLEVAGKITPASSAAEASLSIALASALLQSPVRTLRLVGSKYPIEEVCGIPFLKADSVSVVSYYDSATAALQKVLLDSLAPARTACLKALDDGRERRLERINPGYLIKNKPTPPPRRTRKAR
jgi:hypothetical protein